ncbi:MAG: hypothetical protein LUC43_09870 [Burkholderiales bacterium]|nr:hypothetical protein [Burkholderiales bacterium]
MGVKALTNDKKLAELIYKSVIKSANKKYPANVRLDIMLEFIDSLKVTLEGLVQKQAKKDAKEDESAVAIPTVDVSKFDEPAQALLAEAKMHVGEKQDGSEADENETEPPTPSHSKKSKNRSKKKSKK